MTDEIVEEIVLDTEDVADPEYISVTIIFEQGDEEEIVRIPAVQSFAYEQHYPDPFVVGGVAYSADVPDEMTFDFRLPLRKEFSNVEHFKLELIKPQADENMLVAQQLVRQSDPAASAANLLYVILGMEDHNLRKQENVALVHVEAARIVNELDKLGYCIAKKPAEPATEHGIYTESE